MKKISQFASYVVRLSGIAGAMLLAGTIAVHAQDVYWTGGTAGTWNLTSNNWNGATGTEAAWNDAASAPRAVFTNRVSVTVAGDVIASALVVNTNASFAGSGSLTLMSGGVSIGGVGSHLSLNVPITPSNTVFKTGTGTLEINATQFFTTLNVQTGTVQVAPTIPTAGMIYRLDAANLSSLTTNNYGQVTNWKSSAGPLVNFIPDSGTNTIPIYNKAAFGGRGGVRFGTNVITGGMSSQTRLSADRAAGTNRTVFLVFYPVGLQPMFAGLWGIKDVDAGFRSAQTPANTWVYNPTAASSSSDIVLGGAMYTNGTYISTASPAVVTNTPQVFGLVGNTDSRFATTSQTPSIGRYSSMTARFFLGDIAEVIVYERPLTSNEVVQVSAYLSNKWLGTAANNIPSPTASILPSTATASVSSGAFLELGGRDLTLTSYSGSGTVRNSNTERVPLLTLKPTSDSNFLLDNLQGGVNVRLEAAGVSRFSVGSNAYGYVELVSGTLALGASDTLIATNLILNAGVTFDISAKTSGYSLSAPLTVKGNISVKAAVGQALNLATDMALPYDGANPVITATQGSVTISAGKALTVNLASPLGVGTNILIQGYSGTAPSFLMVDPAKLPDGALSALRVDGGNLVLIIASASNPVTVTLTAPTTAIYGDVTVLTATVAPASGSGETPIGVLHFKRNGAELVSGALVNGSLTITNVTLLNVGSYDYAAVYDGAPPYKTGTSATNSCTVQKRNLTLTPVVPQDKLYDGNTAITFTGGLMVNNVAGTVVSVSVTAAFTNALIGNSKPVMITVGDPIGLDSGNYTLDKSLPAVTANIVSTGVWQGGNGTWNTTVTGWTPSSVANAVTWDTVIGPSNSAVFNATSGTVSLANVCANGMVFNVGGYTLQGGMLTIPSSGMTLNAAAGETRLFTPLYGGALTKTGTGALTLGSQGNAFTNLNVATGSVSLFSAPSVLVTNGLVYQLDASDTSKIMRNSSGVVTNWVPKVGAVTFIGTPTQGPLYDPNALNGKGAIVFGVYGANSNTSTRLTATGATSNRTVVIMQRPAFFPQPNFCGIWGKDASDLGMRGASSGQVWYHPTSLPGGDFSGGGKLYADGLFYSGDAPVMATPHVLAFTSAGTQYWQSALGDYWNNMGRFYNGAIAEVLVYDRVLDDAEIQQLNSYLLAKWSAPQPSGLPVTAGLTYDLDASANVTYDSGTKIVSSWSAAAGGIAFANAVASNSPVYNPSAFGGKGAVVFGTNAVAGTVSTTRLIASAATSQQSVFIVSRPPVAQNRLAHIWGPNGTDNGIRCSDSGAQWQRNSFVVNRLDLNGVQFAADAPYVVGQPQVLLAVGNSIQNFVSVVGDYVNGTGDYAGRYFKGEVAEVVAYSRTLSDAEVLQVERYLANKWGCSVTAAPLPTNLAVNLAGATTLNLGGTAQTVASLASAGGVVVVAPDVPLTVTGAVSGNTTIEVASVNWSTLNKSIPHDLIRYPSIGSATFTAGTTVLSPWKIRTTATAASLIYSSGTLIMFK